MKIDKNFFQGYYNRLDFLKLYAIKYIVEFLSRKLVDFGDMYTVNLDVSEGRLLHIRLDKRFLKTDMNSIEDFLYGVIRKDNGNVEYVKLDLVLDACDFKRIIDKIKEQENG